MMEQIARQSKSSQDPFELWQLLEILKQIEPKRILEIGVHRAGSIETWRTAFPNCDVTGIENDARHIEFSAFNLIVGDSHSHHIRNNAKDCGPFDFLFIDGDHTYNGVSQDWELYAPLVRPGGIIALHDTKRIGERWTGNVEVAAFFAHLQASHKTIELWNGSAEDGPGTGVVFV